ncbi:MAG: hypothetical protein REJ23_05470 [Brevundimonas sp.]|nr:hypothetical protein [Brevundimonas sp.]
MSAFEFLFSFYGLLLGLSIAELATGFSRAWDRRKTVPIGWAAPLLAIVLMLDLVSFWTNSWGIRERIEVDYYVTLAAATVALFYYFAATQVFPREGSTVTPTDHVMAHRRSVVIAVILSNLLVTVGFCIAMGFSWRLLGSNLLLNAPYFLLLVAIGWLPGQRGVLIALGVSTLLSLVYQPLMFGLAGLTNLFS